MGAAHNECNLQRQELKKIPMFCHNFSNYDAHFIIDKMVSDDRIHTLKALPYNTERFRTIQLNSFHMVDSAAFLKASLDDLVNGLSAGKRHAFNILKQMELTPRPGDSDQLKLLTRKGWSVYFCFIRCYFIYVFIYSRYLPI